MSELNWKRVEYETWDEAFRGQIPAVRQQAVRVAAYTQVLFLQACEDGFGVDLPGGKHQIRAQYGELAYKCGLYHQLGKSLVPPEYQLLQPDFTEEELAVYRKYTTDGRLLVATLQERGQRAKEKRSGILEELPTKNIPWQMIRESCEQHMERYNGSGYPQGRRGEDISPIAQIVGLAKELDRLSAETKREDPFEYAYNTMISQERILWSPAQIALLKSARFKCRVIYRKFIHYTMTLPKTIPLLEKKPNRPMGLTYYPMVADKEGTVAAYEAEPWFGAIANRPGETETMETVHDMLERTELVGDMSFYFLYEAADAVARMENCQLEGLGILVHMLPGFYQLPTQLQRLNQLFEDQGIPKEKLLLTIPAAQYAALNKTRKEIVGRYLRAGVALVLDDYRPEHGSPEELKDAGFRYVRFAADLSVQQETAERMDKFRENGFTLLGKGADDFDRMSWQIACGVAATRGTLTPVAVDEETLIRDRLAALR